MLRYAVSLVILAAGIVWLSLGAPVIGGPGLLESQQSEDFLRNPDRYCDVLDPSCQDAIADAINAGRPTPLAEDPTVRDTFLTDELIQNLTSARSEGVDYWVKVQRWQEMKHGVAGATVQIYFASPISFEADVTITNDPCESESVEGYVPRDTPCLLEPYEYRTEHRTFTDIDQFQVNIDPVSGLLFNPRKTRFATETVAKFIEEIDAERASAE